MTSVKTMKAAILVESNQPLAIAEIALPSQLDIGQVLVQIHYSGICGAQINEIQAAKGPDKFLPHLLGHEGVGTVIETGPGVTAAKPGDLVVLHWRKGKGIQANPPAYDWNGQRVNSGWVTTFSEYSIVSENRITPIPKDFDQQTAPLFGCAVTTAIGVINNNAQVKIGQSVVIFGAGGVGLNMVQAAAMVSAYPIIAIDLFDDKLKLASKLGATHIINSNKTDAKTEIQKIVENAGVDVAIDNTGQPRIIELAYELTKPQGKVVLVGVPKKGNNITIYSLPIHFKKIITGSEGGETYPTEDIPRYIKLCQAGKLNLKEVITDHFHLDDINIAIEKMTKGEITGRCLVKCKP
ncbi:MAG: zinc-binding dehydrogenase [Candidatus Omnitrophota bacterium]